MYHHHTHHILPSSHTKHTPTQITDDEEDAEDLRDMLRGVDESLLDDDDEDLLDRGDDDDMPVDGELDPDMAEFEEDAEGEGDADMELVAQLDASRIKALAVADAMRDANARAGVELALQMLPHWVRLGGPVSLEDMRMIAKVIIVVVVVVWCG